MDWEIKKRGRVTYYRKKSNTGFDDLASMDPTREIPRIFDTWQMYMKKSGICDSLEDLDFLEVHWFGAAPKTPNPIVDPEGYTGEEKGIRQAYHQAYSKVLAGQSAEQWSTCPLHGIP